MIEVGVALYRRDFPGVESSATSSSLLFFLLPTSSSVCLELLQTSSTAATSSEVLRIASSKPTRCAPSRALTIAKDTNNLFSHTRRTNR